MKANIRSRNIGLNAYVGILAVTGVAGFATLFLMHVINDVPLSFYTSADAYDIGVSR